MATTITRGEGAKIRKRALALVVEQRSVALALGKLLFEIDHTEVVIGKKRVPLLACWGFGSLADYAEHELGIHKTPANSYVRVYRKYVVELGYDMEQLPSYTKLLGMLSVINADNHSGWVNRALGVSCCALDREIDAVTHGEDQARRTMSFQTRGREYDVVRQAMAQAMTCDGVFNQGQAIALIASEWSKMHRATRKLRKVA